MTVHRKALPAKVETVGDREVRVICSSEAVDRSGEIVVQNGIDLSSYLNNPIVLWQHNVDAPVGSVKNIGVDGGQLVASVAFAPTGVSAKADEICGLVKAGVVNAVSIGFTPLETEPLDKNNPKKGPQKYLKSELCELSFVSVPANRDAGVVERAAGGGDKAEWKCGASRNLDVDTSDDWDGQAAADSIFAKAGFDGEDPDTTFARKGFLAYDASAPEKKGSYKLPFAHVKDGRLVAVKGGIHAASSRLPQTDIPEEIATKAKAVIEHYEGKMKDKSSTAQVRKDVTPIKFKDLYDVANAAYALQQLGYLQQGAAFEAEYEGDGSKVPAMIADACRALADALLAMTQEEVAEMLATMPAADSEPVVKAMKRKGIIQDDASPLQVALALAGVTKAGRKFSAANEKTIRDACKSMADGCEMAASGHEKIKAAHASLNDMLEGNADDEDGSGSDANASASDTDDEQKAARQARLKKVRELALSPA